MSAHVLPDSRLAHRADLGSVMVDWLMPDGSTVRVEVVPIFCGSCGTEYGYVPRHNTTFVFWLCRPCYEQYGAIACTYAVPEEEFNRAVAFEMEERFGHHLSPQEIAYLVDRAQLGSALENLMKDSPYPVME